MFCPYCMYKRLVYSSHRCCSVTVSWTQAETCGSHFNYAWPNLPSFRGNEHTVLFWYKVTSLAVIAFDEHQEDCGLKMWEPLFRFPMHWCFYCHKGHVIHLHMRMCFWIFLFSSKASSLFWNTNCVTDWFKYLLFRFADEECAGILWKAPIMSREFVPDSSNSIFELNALNSCSSTLGKCLKTL